jgi:cytohesin
MLILLFLVLSLRALQAEAKTREEMFVEALNDGNLNTIETLLSSGFDPNEPVHGYTALWFAINSGKMKAVELLLAAHANPNALLFGGHAGRHDETPLQYAVQLGHVPFASILIEAGAKVDAIGTAGRAPLHFAVVHHDLQMMHLLIENGANVNIRDAEGASPLDDAIWRGGLDEDAILLAHGARLNEPHPQTGATAINEAAFIGYPPVVQYLLQFHPDLAIPDKRGYSPLDNAIRRGKDGSAELLLEAEPKEQLTPEFLRKTMDAAANKDEPLLVAALLRHGWGVNGRLVSGSTPLDAAVFAGQAKVVRVLLDNGADPNISGRNGSSPLENASLKGFDSIVSTLLDHGAQVNYINYDSGSTALYAAASFGKGDVVKLLLDRGADATLCGKTQKSPYQAALDNGYSNVAAEIKRHGGSNGCQR